MTENSTAAITELRRQAQFHMDAEQWDAARAALESLLQRTPGDVPTRIQMASVLLRQGRLQAASRQLLDAVPLLPNHVPLIAQLTVRLLMLGEVEAARACLDHLARAPHPPASVLAEQAHLHWMIGDVSSATSLMGRAVAAGVDRADDRYLHAMLLRCSGKLVDAEGILASCLQRWPDLGDAAVMLVNLRKQTSAANHLDLLRGCLDRLPAPDGARASYVRAQFESAVFKVLDDLGSHDEAWAALERSNALMHKLNPYNESGEVAAIDALIKASRELTNRPAALRPPAGPTPIFIVGMPRSGTTLLNQMLAAHSQVTSAGEINDFPSQLRWMTDAPPAGVQGLLRMIEGAVDIDFAELGARYIRQTAWRARGRQFYIDKLPINVRMVPFIRRALPHAPILHMVRDPMDVCFSNLKVMFGNASAYCYEQQALAHYYKQYSRLTDHWRAALPGVMLDVSYAALVTEPRKTLDRVLVHCGLDPEEGCLHPERNTDPVATQSSAQVREPIHSRSMGEWQHYAKYLGPLQRALA
ncbi:sulfotransferase [Frateuria sp. MAH-13]|uniref:Sulfotransferase n=1 Tax=Frateuria flava TaxID=2821489 RepID=A0ABS4DPA1_9GAMM|nr:sulfotransferase [Frateuria flava]MBP1474866.1 sulfotransferase [Frateuria flava]